jgi:hypothetical protein
MANRALPLALLALAPWTAAAAPAAPDCRWKEVQGVRIPVPPPEHPRLYLRARHVPDLAARLEHPVLKPVAEALRQAAKKDPQYKMEWNAVQYLVGRDKALGLATVAETLDLLKKTELANVGDACRATGRMMVTGAIVYDWLHPLLTPEQKDAYKKELVRLAGTLECGYPPARQGSVTGHSSEAMILRDLLSAGIALYDEFPEMYDLAAGRFFRDHLPARNWQYDGHAHHQGDAYGPYRFAWDLFPLWIFDRLGAGNVYNPEQRNVPYVWLYTRRPDGQRLRAGDCFLQSSRLGAPWGLGMAALLTASYYGDGHLLHEHLRRPDVGDRERLFELLWRDPSLQPRPPDDLPLTRHFGPPFGWTVARTGWGDDAVVAEMKVNVFNFTNHQHLDAGAFQVYYRGALAVDSGLYEGSAGGYGCPHDRDYQWRTVAHNCLLVHDPKETFGREWENDGGQRLPNNRSEPATLDVLRDPKNGYQTGEVLAQGSGPDPKSPAPDYTWLTGDLTRAYSQKVRLVVRSFVFLNLKTPRTPAALVVFDRVVSADPAFRKTWLLHALEEPQVEGSTATVDRTERGGQGRLLVTTLLPEAGNAEIAKVGGPGKEFWVAGRNYPNGPAGDATGRAYEIGAWRLEVSPKQASAEDFFLHVMLVTDRAPEGRLPVALVKEGDRVGCRVGDRSVLFSRATGRVASIQGREVR